MTLTVRVTSPSKLSTAELQAWSDFQRADPALESPYFRPEFTCAVATVRTDVEVAILENNGALVGFLPYQRGALNIGKPVGGKLSDYQGVIAHAGTDWTPAQIVRGAGLACYDFDHLLASQDAFSPHAAESGSSPFLDLSGGYEAYCRGRKQAGSDVVAKTMQKARKLEREVGATEFVAHCTDLEILQTLTAWKSAQYLLTGLADLFAFPWTGELLKHLLANPSDEFGAMLSVLKIDSRPIAITYSLRSRGIVHGWFTAYDKEFAQYSPGAFLFLRMAQEAERLGITKIDLGKGDERYKTSLASSSTELLEGSVRAPAVGLLVRDGWRTARDWMNARGWSKAAEAPARWIRPLREWIAFR